MKSIIVFLIYIGTFVGMFLILSIIGLLWADSYRDVISDREWFIIYAIFIGWWISLFPTREYYLKNEDDLSDIF